MRKQKKRRFRKREYAPIPRPSNLIDVPYSDLLFQQITDIIKRVAPSQYHPNRLRLGIMERRWFQSVRIVAHDRKYRKLAELDIQIDWEQHIIHVTCFSNTATLNKSLPKNERISLWINALVRHFNDFVWEHRLQTNVLYQYIPEVWNDPETLAYVRERLNLEPAASLPWRSGRTIKHVLTERPQKLNEFSLSLTIAQ